MKPSFPHVVDSTILNSFSVCPQLAYRTYFQHWKPQTESVHLVAGGAFASGIEEARRAFYERGLSAEDALEHGILALSRAYGSFVPPDSSAKTMLRMIGALEYYFHVFPLGQDGAEPIKMKSGTSGIEFRFAEPLPVNHPVTGDPIIFAGRADMLAHFAGGIYAFDEKTTTALGASWTGKWEMRGQFTGYTWAAQQMGLELSGTIIRGISILKTKYDHAQAITNRAQFEVDRWFKQTCKNLERMIAMWEADDYDYALGDACVSFSACPMTDVCKSQRPDDILKIYFAQKVWDPLERQEISVEDYEKQWAKK